MADLKVTTPMIPRENVGGKYKPATDQSVEFNDINKVNKSQQEGRVQERQEDGRSLQENMLGRAALGPVLRDISDMSQAVGKLLLLIQVGMSAADVIKDPQIRELLEQLYVQPEELMAALKEQSESAVLFRGEAFDLLREVAAKFGSDPAVRSALVNLLKAFEYNVNSQNSIKTILYNCTNILDYMFTRDRAQFESYLQGLAEMLLPAEQAEEQIQPIPPDPEEGGGGRENPSAGGTEEAAEGEALPEAAARGEGEEAAAAAKERHGEQQNIRSGHPPLEQKEIAQILKSNLLPLLGEIVVKYHQNHRIRDIVMVVVHNIVRLDQGTPESLQEALGKLVQELRLVANLPQGFEQNLMQALLHSNTAARYAQNEVMEKLADAISAVLHDSSANPAVLRQAETLLMSMLQNESSLMNVLHFILPMQTPDGQVLAELYVDPDSEEYVGKNGAGKHSRKIFLSFDSEYHGHFELSFVQTEEKVDFSMWCPEVLVGSFNRYKRQFATIMQAHGYTMSGYQVAELKRPQSIAQVFPHLLGRKVGIDVRV